MVTHRALERGDQLWVVGQIDARAGGAESTEVAAQSISGPQTEGGGLAR